MLTFAPSPYPADVEKRKSFADMKLAMIASGGPQWTFDRTLSPAVAAAEVASDDRSLCNGEYTSETSGDPSPSKENAAEHVPNRPDIVREICRGMEVKIADLGNACWVVRADLVVPRGLLSKE